MKIKFTYTGVIGVLNGVGGTYDAKEGDVAVFAEKVAKAWIKDGFAVEYKEDAKKPEPVKEPEQELEKEEKPKKKKGKK